MILSWARLTIAAPYDYRNHKFECGKIGNNRSRFRASVSAMPVI
ncbi:hypothetical protein NIES2104_66540 [Leptolyngbya sp. NIES-2104]|nr:hypothetical protein NIES2104_66540 [Leptolyngbya sp. NIES-2104]